MKLTKVICLSIIITMLLPISVFANSAPMIMEEDPGFSIAPVGSTPISIFSEYLEFDLSKEQGKTAKVTASYEMKNTSNGEVDQIMLFPFVTSHTKGFSDTVKITADGKPVEFKSFRLEDIPYVNSSMKLNYKDNANKELATAIVVDNIIKMINRSEYLPQNYTLSQIVKVYTLNLPLKDESYQAEVSYKIDPKKHKLLYYNFNSFSLDENGSGKLATWSSSKTAKTTRENAFIVVLGEDSENEAELKSLTGQDITVEEKTLAEFLKNYIVKESLSRFEIEDADELNAYVIKQFDVMLNRNEPFLSLEDNVISSFLYNTYIGAFLYTVNFQAEDSIKVTVEYEMQATIDRSQTKDFTNMFLYLLRPASGWKDFNNLTIKVIPNESKPFVIDSSLPLIKNNETGIYSGQFDSLPEKDFYFVTYKTDKADPPLPAVVRNAPYVLAIIFPVLLIMVLIGIIALILGIVIKKTTIMKGK